MSTETEPTFFLGDHAQTRLQIEAQASAEPVIVARLLTVDIVHHIFSFIPPRQRLDLMWELRRDSPFFAIVFDAQILLWMDISSFDEMDDIAAELHHYINRLWHYSARLSRVIPITLNTVAFPLSVQSTMALVSSDMWPVVSSLDLYIPSDQFSDSEFMLLISLCSNVSDVTVVLYAHEISYQPSVYLPRPSHEFPSCVLPRSLRILNLTAFYLPRSFLSINDFSQVVSLSLMDLYIPSQSDAMVACPLYTLLSVMPRLQSLSVHVQSFFPFCEEFWTFPSSSTPPIVPFLEVLDLSGNPEHMYSTINHLVVFSVRPFSQVRLMFECVDTSGSYPRLQAIPVFREEVYSFCDLFAADPLSFLFRTSRRLESGHTLSMECHWSLISSYGVSWVSYLVFCSVVRS